MPDVRRRQVLNGVAGILGTAGLGVAAGLTLRPAGASRPAAGSRRAPGHGSGVWTADVDGVVHGLVVVGRVVCVSCLAGVVGFDAADGRKLWARSNADFGPVVAAGGLLFVIVGGVGNPEAFVDVLRPGDGARIGRFPGTDNVQAGDGVVYVWGSGRGMYVIRPGGSAGFRLIWSAPDTVVQQVTGGVVFTGDGSALQGTDGAPICAFPAGVTVQLVSDGVAYLGNWYASPEEPGAGLSALDLRDGTRLWSVPAVSTVLAVSEGTAYCPIARLIIRRYTRSG